MTNIAAEEVFEECRYNSNLVQMIRGLLFWVVEPDESRDRKALVLLAEHAKRWAESKPPRLTDDTQDFFIGFCNEVIKAGAKTEGPDMPKPWSVGV